MYLFLLRDHTVAASRNMTKLCLLGKAKQRKEGSTVEGGGKGRRGWEEKIEVDGLKPKEGDGV